MKYVLVIFVTAVVVFAGAFLFFKGPPKIPSYPKNPVSTESAVVSTPSPGLKAFVTLKSGGILSFKAYTLDLPTDWQYTKEGAPAGDIEIDKLILTKDDYKITFYQAATGGAPCLYTGDADMEGPSSRFVSFTEITTATGDMLRRGSIAGNANFTVCEKQGTNPYGEPTSFGHISIEVPLAGTTPAMLSEIDAILASLKKI
ncbi:MAG TPA: hypothetical protein VKC54_00420 [Patescibacteria group bacterium]|nr:hypothetical protein [Patescibacteria group bacterium]